MAIVVTRTPYVDAFTLNRVEDESGVSGTGVVAVGARFPGGKCTLQWLTSVASTAVYDSIWDLEAIHGHGGKTKVAWMDNFVPPMTDSPFSRGQADCAMDRCENAYQHVERVLGGERPKWGREWSDDYWREYLEGYRWSAAQAGLWPTEEEYPE